jgi:hypothetical protein
MEAQPGLLPVRVTIIGVIVGVGPTIGVVRVVIPVMAVMISPPIVAAPAPMVSAPGIAGRRHEKRAQNHHHSQSYLQATSQSHLNYLPLSSIHNADWSFPAYFVLLT